jgi:acetyltransferase-like isoleucine patch superfamily enzyme
MTGAGDLAIPLKDPRAIQAALAARGLATNRGALVPGERLVFEAPCSLADAMLYAHVEIGAYSFCGIGCELREVTIGRFCSIARRVVIGSVDHPIDGVSTHPIAWGSGGVFRKDAFFNAVQSQRCKPWRAGRVTIGNDVWIGNGVFICRGVTIGDGAIIAAGGVVTQDLAPYGIVGGVAARRLRGRFPAEIAARLGATRWWDMDLTGSGIDLSEIETALPALERLRAAGTTPPLSPARWQIRRDVAAGLMRIEALATAAPG